MIGRLDKKIVQELQEEAEKFYKGEWILNVIAIHNNSFLRATHFEMDFNSALDKFRREPPSDEWKYDTVCVDFHKEMTKAKTLNVILDKKSNQDLKNHSQQITELENQLKVANSKIELLIEEKGVLKGKLDVYERDLPKSDTFTGEVHE